MKIAEQEQHEEVGCDEGRKYGIHYCCEHKPPPETASRKLGYPARFLSKSYPSLSAFLCVPLRNSCRK